jgi:predicted MFS family arabinose efflux permease
MLRRDCRIKNGGAIYSPGYQRLVTLLLLAAYTFNSMDRTIVSIIAESIKADLKLTNTEIGLLGGTAFAVLYAFGGIPLARLAERVNRVNIITLALIVWSGLTALCGTAATFPQLLLIRVGVGVAEAGCSPPAHSLISDYFVPSKRASALSVYTSGISLGYILAAVIGGFVAEHYGWRWACAAVGLPGIVTAILIRLLVREPPRGGQDPGMLPRAPAPFSVRHELAELLAVARALLLDPPIRHMVIAITVGAFAAYGFYYFLPLYLGRAFGLESQEIGLIAALTGGVAVGIGIIAGGFLADALARRGPRWYALVPALGGLISVPVFVIAVTSSGWRPAAWALAVAGFFWYTSLGPTFGAVQNAVEPRRRATATALLYITLAVLGLGLGPVFTGWVIDQGTGACAHGLVPPSSAAPAIFDCRSTLALATRRGLLVTLAFFAWATLHYFWAAVGFARRRSVAASSVQSDSM